MIIHRVKNDHILFFECNIQIVVTTFLDDSDCPIKIISYKIIIQKIVQEFMKLYRAKKSSKNKLN